MGNKIMPYRLVLYQRTAVIGSGAVSPVLRGSGRDPEDRFCPPCNAHWTGGGEGRQVAGDNETYSFGD